MFKTFIIGGTLGGSQWMWNKYGEEGHLLGEILEHLYSFLQPAKLPSTCNIHHSYIPERVKYDHFGLNNGIHRCEKISQLRTHRKSPPNVDHHVSVASVLGFHKRILVLQLLRAPVVCLCDAESLSKLGLGLGYIQRLLRGGVWIKMQQIFDFEQENVKH